MIRPPDIRPGEITGSSAVRRGPMAPLPGDGPIRRDSNFIPCAPNAQDRRFVDPSRIDGRGDLATPLRRRATFSGAFFRKLGRRVHGGPFIRGAFGSRITAESSFGRSGPRIQNFSARSQSFGEQAACGGSDVSPGIDLPHAQHVGGFFVQIPRKVSANCGTSDARR